MYVVATGDAFDGVTLTGPFEDNESALNYAEFYKLHDWHIVLIEPPGSSWENPGMDESEE